MEIKKDWNFKEVVNNLKEIKKSYKEKVRSFSYYELHNKVLYIRKVRNIIYSFSFEEWKKDKIWEYMNDFEFLYVLKRLK